MQCIHFVGFRGDEYWSAVRIWGRPHYIHRGWDYRASRDIGDGDLVIFATGNEFLPFPKYNYNDIDEEFLIGGYKYGKRI